jgi:hypothetical protein
MFTRRDDNAVAKRYRSARICRRAISSHDDADEIEWIGGRNRHRVARLGEISRRS